jgi:hypothetical protein
VPLICAGQSGEESIYLTGIRHALRLKYSRNTGRELEVRVERQLVFRLNAVPAGPSDSAFRGTFAALDRACRGSWIVDESRSAIPDDRRRAPFLSRSVSIAEAPGLPLGVPGKRTVP